ncbi:ankyrin repeat domain-containing protein 26 [Aulostomus maculatus]
MKKIFSFTKKKKHPSGTPDNGSVLSAGYELKEKDLGKVHKAAWLGDLAKLKQLAKKNDLNQLDKENRTALHIACASGHVEVVQFLAESKVKLNLCDNQNRSALMKAVQGQHERCVTMLLENHAEPNLVDINGNTALHLASNIPSISTAVMLLEHEADINASNKESFTPLTVAVREDHIEMAEFLLKEGADINFLDQDQRSPLMMAAGSGQIGMLRLLLRFDADITLKDTKGWSADDYAVMNGHHPCSLLIIEHGTQRKDGPSLPHGALGKKKKKPLLGSPSRDLDAGFSLGGPATDKDDFEDNSQSESLSRVSKSAADEWPSSEDDDESALVEKKLLKVNLRKMIASKKGEASALADKSLSGTESDPESENRIQRIPSLLKALPPSKSLQHPLDPSPGSFLSKAPQMTSTPLPSNRKTDIDDVDLDSSDEAECLGMTCPEVRNTEELAFKTEKAKWEPLLSKLEGEHNQKTDVMEEFGVGDFDDIEDASDWDSASIASKRTLPGCRMASPGLEEFPESSNPPVEEEEENIAPGTPLTPSNADKKQLSPPPLPVPHPQPRARKMVLQESEESDLEPGNSTVPCKMGKTDNQLQHSAELQAAVKPDSSEFSPKARDRKRDLQCDVQQQKEKDGAIESCELEGNNTCTSSHVSSGIGAKSKEFRGRHTPEKSSETSDDIPWEKRYEKLWVEVEKREVKSTFKNVAGELKEKFGELFKSEQTADDVSEEKQATAESSSSEESSDDEEVIVRPTARARSTVLLTIPEQRESGLEDSVTDSTDNSLSEDRFQVQNSVRREPDLPKDDAPEEFRSHFSQPTSAKAHSHVDSATTGVIDGHMTPMSPAHYGTSLKDEAKVGSLHSNHILKTKKNQAGSEDDPEEFVKSQHCSRSTRSTSVPGVSDEELEEDMQRFKRQVGMPKVVFLDLEKEKAQLQKEVEDGRPLLNTSRAPVQLQLPLQQTYNNSKQEGQAVKETLQRELVREARGSRAPQTNTHVNGDLLSVFDDSSISDVSDDEGRYICKEMEMAEDFDDLTQSSDTATDDIDSPTSGYRHASLLIQKLDSVTLDSRSMVKLQNIFHEYERSIQKARSRHGYLVDKVSQLEMERAELKSSVEEVKDIKSALERNQLELQTEVTNLKFQLKQEQENGRNATMMYNTTREKLRRTEEQQQLEVQERQKVELTLRNLELEMRTLVNNSKQLEDDHAQTQRLLAQERSARTLQENLLNSHLRKQQEIEEENKRNISRSNEALSQLTEASDREKELLQQNSSLQEQLSILKIDLEHSHANSSIKQRDLLEENEALKERLEDARRDLKLNNDTLTQTVFTCNNQMTTLKSELTIAMTRLEKEQQSRETLAVEFESVRTRLTGATQEAERCMVTLTQTEKALLREKEEHQRLKDKLTGEASSQREAVTGLSQKLSKAEARANSMENEVHRVTMQLTEKGVLLDVLQREKDQIAARIKELETSLQAEKELVSRAGARQEATQERLAQAQSEGMLLRQQLEEAQNKGVAKERAVTDAQERFSDMLSKLRSDCEERVQLVEERNKELASKAADLRDQIYKLEEEKNERETSLRQLQQELADSLKKLSMSEASLEVNTRYRNDLEEEKARLLKDLDRLKAKLEDREAQCVQVERRINSLKSSLEEKEKELTTAAQKHQEALSVSAASDITIKQLEEAVQRLEIENARLEAAAKQQSNKLDALQKGAQEATMLSDSPNGGRVRGHLEDLVANLQSSKMTLEDQLNREVQKQSMLSHTAQDSQALWEEELKTRSKLGLRLAELEKERGELNTQMEIEKKKAKKIAEQKKAMDSRLDQEMKRNTELQKEMYRLRTLLKSAKKKLRAQEASGGEFASPMSSLRMDLGRHSHNEGASGRMKDKVDDLRVQLERESSHRTQLETTNRELKDQLASLKSLSRNNDHLERSNRQLEEEVLDLRRRIEAAQMEQSQVEQLRRDAGEKARQEIQQKLEQVNLFLQSQVASQEALEQINAANEASLRSQLEQKIRELEGELGRARTTQYDSLSQRDSTRTELERYRQLYTEELHLKKSLAAKLDRANNRLSEANSRLLQERSRSLITSSFANGTFGASSLDVGSLGSPANYGASLGPLNRSLGLGLSLLSPVTEGQSSRVEDYLAKMQSEFDRSISKELSSAAAELDVASARMSPVGSASRVELDPLTRAKQQYLEVLKKNNMI